MEPDKRKCRHYNRGYCKYGNICKFSHPSSICDSYLKEGICLATTCPKRHPKNCRYWIRKREGCMRQDSCQYLHKETTKYKPKSLAGSKSYLTCDACKYRGNDNHDLKKHEIKCQDESAQQNSENLQYHGEQCNKIETTEILKEHLESKHPIAAKVS